MQWHIPSSLNRISQLFKVYEPGSLVKRRGWRQAIPGKVHGIIIPRQIFRVGKGRVGFASIAARLGMAIGCGCMVAPTEQDFSL